MGSEKSNIYLNLLSQELEKVASSQDELKVLTNKAQNLLALAMRSSILDDRAIVSILED